MRELYELKDKLCEELKEYGKKDMSAGSLDVIDKLAHTIKNLDKIIETYNDGGYSGNYMPRFYDGMNMAPGSYAMGNRSYARGRGSNANRDSMGRYSSNGYSYGNEDMISELREMMNDAPDKETRAEFQRFISRIEGM